ncbi:MAG: YfhO family protein, partial [Clostridia bacterium]|nr:YfhO family protein [Clostridia bacterium]
FLPAETETDSAIASLISSLKGALNRLLNIDETVNSAEYEDEYYSPFERLNAILSAMLGDEVEVFVPVEGVTTSTQNLLKATTTDGQTRYAPSNNDLNGVLTYSLTMPADAELFFYAPATAKREVQLNLRSEGTQKKIGNFNGTETRHIISLGWQTAETDLALDLTLKDKYFYVMKQEKCFYYIDWAAFEDAMARLAQDQLVIEEYTETSFDGTFTASRENERVLTTLPYDKGWKIYVDGEAVETEKALGALVSFRIEGEAGQTHSVRMVYRPNVVWVGLSISCVSLALLILLIVLEKRIKKIKYLRTLVSIPEWSVPKKAEPEQPAQESKAKKHK